MKKQTFTIMVLICIGTGLRAQVMDKPASKQSVKTETNSTEQLTFQSIEEKNAEVEKIQKLIDYRISKGKTQEEMAIYYVELKRTMNALITPKTNKNEK